MPNDEYSLGYVNNLASLETIINIVKDLKEKNPGLKYCMSSLHDLHSA
jgi:pyridoxal/pyridoxine/pyridoxamine kinase